jgi:hypothetical protein
MILEHYEFQVTYIQVTIPSLSIPHNFGVFCSVAFFLLIPPPNPQTRIRLKT